MFMFGNYLLHVHVWLQNFLRSWWSTIYILMFGNSIFVFKIKYIVNTSINIYVYTDLLITDTANAVWLKVQYPAKIKATHEISE